MTELTKFKFDDNFILQLIKDDYTSDILYFKNIKQIQRFLNDIPYSALINIYYTCSNKGGSAKKDQPKKHIHRKYLQLLKSIRIFDSNNKGLIDDKEYFNKLLKC